MVLMESTDGLALIWGEVVVIYINKNGILVLFFSLYHMISPVKYT
jgi:hypothetical protein